MKRSPAQMRVGHLSGKTPACTHRARDRLNLSLSKKRG